MKKLIALLIMALMCTTLFAVFNPAYSDYQFYNVQEFKVDRSYLEAALADAADGNEKAEILWRLSRTVLTITDDISDAKENKQARLDGYGLAQSYAEESIAINPSADAYHWLASCMGRIGQVNGPLNSLSKAKPMLGYVEIVQNDFGADMSDSWYVLGLLYNQLPGGPISFGNNDYAISYMRRCLDTQDTINRSNLTNFLELSNQLYDRNWDAKKRAKEFDKMEKKYNKESIPTEKMKYYEGKDGKDGKPFYSSVTLDKMDDRQEAVMLLKYALMVYEAKPNKLESETKQAKVIEQRIADIT